MSDLPLLFERDGGVVRLTLNRPTQGNAINTPLARALMEAAIECDEDPAVRVVILTGAGRFFCAGGDIEAFSQAGDRTPHLLKELTAYLHMAVSRLARMPKPLVTAVNGAAAGAGLSLAMLGDVTLAARSAKFASAYAGIGLPPDGGATWLLPRLVGLRQAQEIMLTGRRYSAEEAAQAGLITRVVDDAVLAVEADQVVQRLSASATRALGRTRNLLLASYGATLEDQMEREARAIAESGRDLEHQEGVSAFLARRAPSFGSGV